MSVRFYFGQLSHARLRTCHVDLQRLMYEVMAEQLIDLTILTGHRNEVEQEAAFAAKASKVRWPDSMHNQVPSMAVDIAPYPIRWGERDDPQRVKAIGRFYLLAGIVLATARELAVPVRWGGDWNQDGDILDQSFDDIVHFELAKPA